MLFRIGTRGSKLALAQTKLVSEKLEQQGHQTEIIIIKTTGDKYQTAPLSEIGGKALFAKELQNALLEDVIDIAVHSLKDLETKHPEGLLLLAVLEREDPRDVIISQKGTLNTFLKEKKPFILGTCSPRRAAFSKHLWPNVTIVPLRGNVDSRLQKVVNNDLDATILALAGLKRLGIFDHIQETLDYQILETSLFTPASCQGIVAIEGKEKFKQILQFLNCKETYLSACLEREKINDFNANCHSAIGVHVENIKNEKIIKIMHLDDHTQNIEYREIMI